ncbi:MAG: hypothetical protein WA188_08340 [Terriglobales bacterium]
MRISLSINGIPPVTAAVNGPGYLNAHLNLHDRPKEDDNSKVVSVVGTQTLETETVGLDWPQSELQVGDVLEFRLLNDGEGDPPSKIRRSSEHPDNLLANAELAKELLALVSDFESRLWQFADKSEKTESPDEHKRFTYALGHVAMTLGKYFLYPIYRRRKELVPDELKGELL